MTRSLALTGVMICTLLTAQSLGNPVSIAAAPTATKGYVTQVTANTFVNPSYDEINFMLEEIAKEKDIPSIILKSIAFKESSWRQFDKQGNPLLGSNKDHPAIGIMQIATYNDDDLETIETLKTDIEYNIRMGADLLNEKWRFTPTIGDGDRNKLENWYFAIWAYNIWTDKNNPNVLVTTDPSALTYQEKVLRIMANPEGFFAQYIKPVEVTRMPVESLPATGVPAKIEAWSTPEPIHYGDLVSSENPNDPNGPTNPENPGNPVTPGTPDTLPPHEQVPNPPPPNNPPSRGGQPPQTFEFIRLAGDNRIETAVKQALKGWSEGADTVVLARADHFPDALAGVPLAARYQAPILLTSSKNLSPEVEEALKALKPTKVVLLGGEGALGPQVVAKLEALGWRGENQIRLNGLNRYETAAAIALTTAGLPLDSLTSGDKNTQTSIEAIAIATGQNFPDALSIASIAGIKQMPILLTETKTLPKETKEALKALNPQKVYLIGGEGAIAPAVQTAIQEQLNLSSSQLVRLYGNSRYDTMAAVAEAFAGEGQGLCFATGQDFPDALAGAALAARLHSKVILLPKGSLEDYPRLKNVIAQYPWNKESQPYIFGGEGAIPPERVQELKKLLLRQ